MIEDMGVPEGWRNVRLGDVCKMVIGGTPSRDNLLYWDKEKSTNNLWVSIKDMDRRYIENTEEYLTDEGVKHSNAKLIPPNTVLLSFKLTIGKISVSKKFLYTNEAIAAIITKNNELDNLFLFYGLHKWDLLQDVDQAVKGMTLNKNKLQAIKILYPSSLPEQRKIAEILETVDNAIERTDTIIEKYKRIKQGLMQDLLTRGVVENDELGVMSYELRDEKKHRFNDSPLGRIPEEWEVVEFKDICKVRQGLQIAIANRFKEPGHKRYIYITIQYLNSNDKEKDAEYIQNPPRSVICRKNDLLMTRTGNTGMVITDVEGVFHNNFFLVDYDKKEVDKMYLFYYLNIPWIQEQIGALAGTTTIPDLNHNDFYSLKFLKPPLSEQHRIASILSQTDETIEKEQKYKQKLESIKQGLMEDLLTGKVRVNHLIKEGMENVQTA